MLIAGLLAAWLDGLIGTGGCAILLPVFMFWMGYPAPVAIGTTLFVVIFTALSGAYGYYRQRNLDKEAVAWMAPYTIQLMDLPFSSYGLGVRGVNMRQKYSNL